MSSGESLKGVVRHLRSQLGDAPADIELLTRYAQRRDEAAFAALVRRHGSLVFGVARRQLADSDQAEDVFQATFLALARSAVRLGRPVSLASWLYTVALRQARKVRLRATRRAAREQALLPRPPAADPLDEITGRELVSLIDEELARLPEAYRLPLLLCGVQGLSREEAARQLGWSDGVVKGRLERGRRQLAARLAKRGIAPSTMLLAPLAAVVVPDRLEARAVHLAVAPWSRSIPATVAVLAAAGMPPRLLPLGAFFGSLLVVGLIGLALAATRKEPTQGEPPAASTAGPAADAGDDPLPAGSTIRFGTSRFRHGTAIEALAISPDERIVIASSASHWLGSTRAYDLATGRALYKLENPPPLVEAAAFSPDGRVLVTRENDAIHVRDATTGKELRKFEPPNANPRSLTHWLTFTPDGKALAFTAEGKIVHLFDIERGSEIRSFAHQNVVYAAAFSPDGRLLAAGGYDSSGDNYFARLWDMATGKELRRCPGIRGGIRTLAFSPDGAILAGGGDDGRVRLWDVATGKVQRTLPANGRRIRSVDFAPDGRILAAAGAAVRLVDPATGQEKLHIDRQASGLHFSADGHTLTGAVDGAIYRWDTATGKALTPEAAGDSAVDQILPTPDGRRIITRDQAGLAHFWDMATGRHLRRLEVAEQRNIALSPDGRFLAWSAADPTVKFKDPEHANWTHEGSRIRLLDLAADRAVERFAGFEGEAHDLTFTADSETLVAVDHNNGTVWIWDAASGKQRRTFRVVRGEEKKRLFFTWVSALSPDGRTLAVGYQRADDTSNLFGAVVVRLFDMATGQELHELTGHINHVLGLAFSPDSRVLVTCGENAGGWSRSGGRSLVDRVFVWDVASGKPVRPGSDGLPIGAACAAFAPDGRTLATASGDSIVRLWEVATWTVRAEFKGHRDRVSALAFGSDGRLFSGSLDTTVLAWDVRPPRPAVDGPLAATWDELSRAEAAPAFRAQGRLQAAPAEAVALLADRLKPVAVVEAKRLLELIADLDSPEFATRDQATTTLRQIGRPAATVLREAKNKSTSVEVRRRAGTLLAELEESPVTTGELRALRAVEVLEWVATPAARQLLAELAKGAPGAVLTQAAEAALKRLQPE
jgi:RNA polymerase sigma factor (sigma-70 family)